MGEESARAEVEAQVLAQLRQHFRPEFLNRVDDIIVFRPLGADDLVHIVEQQLQRVRRMLGERKIVLEVTDAAKALIAEEGYDPAYGARPLKRAIQKHIQNPLAIRLLEGQFDDGDRIRIDRAEGSAQLTFEHAGEAVQARG
jgi:ATP-dependent Clp protease ATP-binding subunit ClpB